MRIVSILAAVVIAACSSNNPVQTATQASPENRPEVIAFALHNSYVVIAEQAATVAESADTPEDVKRVLVGLHERTSPVVKELRFAAEQYNSARAALASGESTEEKVSAALLELNRLIQVAAPKIDSVATAITR